MALAMNTIARHAFKALSLSGSKALGFTKPMGILMKEQRYTDGLTRSLWLLCNGTHHSHKIVKGEWSNTCGCDCSTVGSLHTKGDKDLVEFLEEEIKAEVKTQKQSGLPKIEGFDIQTEGGNVTLTKKFNGEIITVQLNVNLTVNNEVVNDEEPLEINENQKEPEFGEMKSKPDFIVDIAKGGKGLSLSCIFSSDDSISEEESQDSNDIFQISELSLYEGEMKDSTYAVSGGIIDGYLYDLLMNMLEDRGVSNGFAEKLVDFCTTYEHQQYVGLLQGLKSFVSGK